MTSSSRSRRPPNPAVRVGVQEGTRPSFAARPRGVPLVVLVATTMFVGAGLLFWVQPMTAKMILPSLGGTPAVWNTCQVFFQAMLLAGYAYAHLSIRWLG